MTKDADKLLCCLYCEYLQRIQSGNSKTASANFTIKYTCETIMPLLHPDDVAALRNELKRLNFVVVSISGNFRLTDNAVIYMENRFKNNIIELTDFISKFL